MWFMPKKQKLKPKFKYSKSGFPYCQRCSRFYRASLDIFKTTIYKGICTYCLIYLENNDPDYALGLEAIIVEA